MPELLGLFGASFLAATLLPGGSEAVLLVLAHQSAWSPVVLLIVASTGNTLGGLTSYLIGRALPAKTPERPGVARAVERVRRYGAVSLLLSWVPIIGDPLCVAAGWLRINWLPVLLFMAVGKTARYALAFAFV